LVKHYPDGKQSTHLHSLKPGDKLLFAAALRGHQWVPNSVPHVTLIAGGAGVTPIFQLAQGILSNPNDKTAVTIVYGVNTNEDCHLTKEFQEFENEFKDRFKIVYTVSRPDEKTTLRKGRVTKELLEEVVLLPENGDTKVFICGPPDMESSLVGSRKEQGILEQLGYRKDQIHTF
jgi:cytochrome-b5 reductase